MSKIKLVDLANILHVYNKWHDHSLIYIASGFKPSKWIVFGDVPRLGLEACFIM